MLNFSRQNLILAAEFKNSNVCAHIKHKFLTINPNHHQKKQLHETNAFYFG